MESGYGKNGPFYRNLKKTTTQIHEQVKGARGSFMLQNEEHPNEIKTVARLDSLEDWERFWEDSNPTQMQSMRDLGERVSVEIFREIDDFTR